jgi:hypothetical protein
MLTLEEFARWLPKDLVLHEFGDAQTVVPMFAPNGGGWLTSTCAYVRSAEGTRALALEFVDPMIRGLYRYALKEATAKHIVENFDRLAEPMKQGEVFPHKHIIRIDKFGDLWTPLP